MIFLFIITNKYTHPRTQGKYYAVNIPLRDGMDDESYESIFVPIISKVMETFQPSAVVLQCGADSLTGMI